MTWEELSEKAKEMGYYVYDEWVISLDGTTYYKSGVIDTNVQVGKYSRAFPLATNRAPEQMYQIMEALR